MVLLIPLMQNRFMVDTLHVQGNVEVILELTLYYLTASQRDSFVLCLIYTERTVREVFLVLLGISFNE